MLYCSMALRRSLIRTGSWAAEACSIPAATQASLQVLVVPGNPGNARFYECFLKLLHGAFDGTADVVAVSHLGHHADSPHHPEVRHEQQQAAMACLHASVNRVTPPLRHTHHRHHAGVLPQHPDTTQAAAAVRPPEQEATHPRTGALHWVLHGAPGTAQAAAGGRPAPAVPAQGV